MKFYFAPMEGINGYIYRNAYHQYFNKIDKYFMPFVAPTQNKKLSSKAINDMSAINNEGLTTVPQVLTNKADQFIFTAEAVRALGYNSVNLNLGCPSSTVVSKKKGSGFLGDLEVLNYFLDEVFEKTPLNISIKTRLGIDSETEFKALMKIFNQYPLEELIIHPRTQKDYYKNTPHLDVFEEAVENKTMPIVYNGDIFTVSDYQKFIERFPEIETVMLGRGLLGNPNLISDINEEKNLSKEVLRAFHDKLLIDYKVVMSGERPVLYKMKELWFYMIHLFEEPTKYLKNIRKSQNLHSYMEVIEALFLERNLVYNGDNFHDIIKGIRK